MTQPPMIQPAPTTTTTVERPETAPGRATASFDTRGARIGVVIPAYRVAPQIERVIRGLPAWVVGEVLEAAEIGGRYIEEEITQ